jgi:hypothetical protein
MARPMTEGDEMAEAIVIKVEKGMVPGAIPGRLEAGQAMTILVETANELVCQDAE